MRLHTRARPASTLIRIGDFSRLARVCIRTLRHYEEEGLLPPAQVDVETGYRYYRADQLMVIHRVGAMRDIGLSIAQIRQLLALDTEGLSIQLRRHEEQLQDDLAAAQTRLSSLRGMFRWLTTEHSAYASLVRVRPLPPVTAYTIRQRVPSLGRPVTELFEHAERQAASDRIDQSPFMIFFARNPPDGELDVEICVPVRTGSSLAAVRTIEGSTEAVCVTYTGPYSQTAVFFEGLLSWLDSTGSAAAVPYREVYHRFGADLSGYRLPRYRVAQSDAEFVTELQLPVCRSQAASQR